MTLKDRRDRARLEYLQTRAAEFRAQADQTTDARERAEHLTAARQFDRMYRTERAFPIGVWLWGARVLVVLLPWSILGGNHHPTLGLLLSVLVLVILVGFAVRKRRRPTNRE
jgi:hypothetical protein